MSLRVSTAPPRLLRAHVTRAAHNRARDAAGVVGRGIGHRQRIGGLQRRRGRLHHKRQAKIQNFNCVIDANHHVPRLEIAMNNTPFMSGFQRLGDLASNHQGLARGHPAVFNTLRQRRPFDKFHHQILLAVAHLELVNRGDVRMIDRG